MKRKESDTVDIPQVKRPRRTMETQNIQLTPRESQLRNLLLDAARYIDESKEIKDKIELRWAGGWVRDKLLGLPSQDIDVAINAMTGVGFCEKMQEYLKDAGNMTKHSLSKKDVGSLHKIAANPNKSKHLETVNTRLYDFDLDFVNLRKETYSDDSRNPQMEFGTPEEDALRRDATINALFYNLHSGMVEDFTGGLEDMRAKLIRTPLEPFTTFKDDPLRVLRLIRFASRLGFVIDSESEQAMSNAQVLDALKLKISRERIGIELQKMLKGKSMIESDQHTLNVTDKNARNALHFIDRLGLYQTIFFDPSIMLLGDSAPNTSKWHLVYDCLEDLENTKDFVPSIYGALVRSEEERYLAWILAALTPYIAYHRDLKAARNFQFPGYAVGVAKEGIKADNKICNVVAAAFQNAPTIIRLKLFIAKLKCGNTYSAKVEDFLNADHSMNDLEATSRCSLGMRIREWESKGGHWRVQVLFALLAESLGGDPRMSRGSHLFRSLDSFTDVPTDLQRELYPGWRTLITHLGDMDLLDVEKEKPLVDGTRLQKDLNVKPGKWMKGALDACMKWQLEHYELALSDPEQVVCGAIEMVRERSEELKIPIKSQRNSHE